MDTQQILAQQFNVTRAYSHALARPLWNEDYSVQPAPFVSPPKWHLAHTTWFWEQFVLRQFDPGYRVYDDNFGYLFNSYYDHVGPRVKRAERGLLTRPAVAEIYHYRASVDDRMRALLRRELPPDAHGVIELGLQHEQQHQELFVYDIKYILGHQPTFPVYGPGFGAQAITRAPDFHHVAGGLYEIGHHGKSFCFDNELSRHQVYLGDFAVAENLVTNAEYLEFMSAGGYTNAALWHDAGWAWKQSNDIAAPLYWHQLDGAWQVYDLEGLKPLALQEPVRHVSFYEAFAFAEWSGLRLPTEFEWEVAAPKLDYGQVWEWTSSAYQAYPHFKKAPGALGEYNGKFMVNQLVLRGASVATPIGHSRITYRNFFAPEMRWHYGGLRLAR